MRAAFLKLLLVIFLYTAFFSCAKRGTPTGGPKDSIPPILVNAIPKLETVNFKEKKIKLYFDEYIKIKDAKKNLVISPPQQYDPIITPAGTASKFITIKILDTLEANTTYSFNFGNSIVDNNEENKFQNFKYVFSTGTFIDSLKLSGKVTNPLIKKSLTNIDVMLYEYNDKYTDSIIYKQKPRYIANTLDSTLFEITNIREGKYLLIALQDANSNKIYNPEIDKIGFIGDTVTLPTDKNYDFTIFKEVPKLKVIKPKEVNKGHAIFGFAGNANDLIIDLLSQTPEDFKSEIIYEKNKDTLNYWFSTIEADSLNFKVSKGDYAENFTLKLRSSKIDSLKVTPNSNGILHLIDTFYITTNTPIINFDPSLIKISKKDSTIVPFTPILAKSKNKLYLNFEKEVNTEYTFEILPKTITDIYQISNDSISYKLKTKTLEDYGTIALSFNNPKNIPLIVELLNEKEQIIRIAKISNPQIINFELLLPGNYMIRVTLDENNNGVWDTGNFLNKKQPEIVQFFDKIIELRANYELNETFDIN
ncbi:Ig-like domain-containing protein [Lutibacter sp.]|uniref:Ig-like domain-containing protein n=1 Tax=Lutibacter sp. TaxID=1925666 RepID=UPI001A1E6403|nr:Ig-like domain-containing protein [Lutibacter sp.]MBI9039811.1 Ig-like domain-containing protein [Lutibacter sp.]